MSNDQKPCPTCGCGSTWNGTNGSTPGGSKDVWRCPSGHTFETPR
jgi:hypothetical protein